MLVFVALAWAGVPVWKWTSEDSRRYLLEMRVESPYVMRLLQRRNVQARVIGVGLAADMRCRVHEAERRGEGWWLACTVSDARLAVTPIAKDVGRTDAAVSEYEQSLEASEVRFRLTPQGEVSAVSLTEGAERDERSAHVHQMLERFMELALAPFDVKLPPPSTTIDGSTWAQATFLPAEIPTRESATGSLTVEQRLETYGLDRVILAGTARGGITVDDDAWTARGTSATEFDPVEGSFVASSWDLRTKVGATARRGREVPYGVSARATLVADETEVALMPPADRL